MASTSTDVVIVGGGIVGIATAYYLAKAGVRSVVVERDSVGSHASGFAYGGLSPLVDAGPGHPSPASALAEEGMRLHRELATSLPEETGVNTEYRLRPSLSLAFTEAEATGAQAPAVVATRSRRLLGALAGCRRDRVARATDI